MSTTIPPNSYQSRNKMAAMGFETARVDRGFTFGPNEKVTNHNMMQTFHTVHDDKRGAGLEVLPTAQHSTKASLKGPVRP